MMQDLFWQVMEAWQQIEEYIHRPDMLVPTSGNGVNDGQTLAVNSRLSD